jgi:hypothetical protein
MASLEWCLKIPNNPKVNPQTRARFLRIQPSDVLMENKLLFFYDGRIKPKDIL